MTEPNLCPECSRPARDGVICRHCVESLRTALADTPWLVKELNVAVAKESRFATSAGRVNHTDHSPIIVNLPAAQAAAAFARTLARWVARLGDSSDAARLAAYDPVLAAAWLIGHLETIRRHDDAPIIFDSLSKARKSAVYVVDRPLDRRYLGECGYEIQRPDGAVVVCRETLWGKLGEPEARCRTCGATWPLDLRLEKIKDEAQADLEEREMTITQAADVITAFKIGRETNAAKLRDRIRKWALSEKLLKSRGSVTSPGRRPQLTYRLGDIIELVERTDTLRRGQKLHNRHTG